MAGQQVVRASALQNTHLRWSGREFQSSDGAAPFASTRTRSPLSDAIQCTQTAQRATAANSAERDCPCLPAPPSRCGYLHAGPDGWLRLSGAGDAP